MYRKQYLTPTIILGDVRRKHHAIAPASAYHKFVKTTPKPSATKKSSGELVGPPLPPPPPPPPPVLGASVWAARVSKKILVDMVGCDNSSVPYAGRAVVEVHDARICMYVGRPEAESPGSM